MTRSTMHEGRETLCAKILEITALNVPRMDFIVRLADAVTRYARVEHVDICVRDGDRHFCVTSNADGKDSGECQGFCGESVKSPCPCVAEGRLHCIRRALGCSRAVVVSRTPSNLDPPVAPESGPATVLSVRDGTETALVSPFAVNEKIFGVIALRTSEADRFGNRDTELWANLAGLVGMAIAQQGTQRALRGRAAELAAQGRIAHITGRLDTDLQIILDGVVEALPKGCAALGKVSARVIIDGQERVWPRAPTERNARLRADVVTHGRHRGFLEIGYDPPPAELMDKDAVTHASSFLRTVSRKLASVLWQLQLRAEKEASQQQLLHADRLAAIGTLAAELTHELSEPLTAIVGFAQLVQKDTSLSPRAHVDLERIITASMHARSVVRRLMGLARRTAPSWHHVDLRDVIDDAMWFISPRIASGQIHAVRKVDPNIPPIVADRTQLCQALVNLALNAVQATPGGGRLLIEAAVDPAGVVLSVEDTGSGMDAETLAHARDPFFTTKPAGEGTGLGLSVVDRIVSLHGGSIHITSTPGAGTRVALHLPLNPPGSLPIPEGLIRAS